MRHILPFVIASLIIVTTNIFAAEPDFLWNADTLTLTFPTPSEDSSGSVPIGNGENAANVWIEKTTGDLLLLLARTDSWDGFGRILKPGRLRISFGSASPFKEGVFQIQMLDLANGLLQVRGQNAEVLVYVDAYRPVYVIKYSGEQSISLQARLEVWRTEKRDLSDEEMGNGNQYGLTKDTLAFEEPDTILNAELLQQDGLDSLAWYHRNTVSIWSVTMKQQGFKDVMDKYHDPLMHRTFGGLVLGRSQMQTESVSFKKTDPQILRSVPAKNHEIFVTLHTAQTDTPEIWCNETAKITQNILADYKNADAVLAAHKKWWNDFWNRSHIRVLSSTGSEQQRTPPHESLTRGYALQRYVQACSGRGNYAMKFNGNLFTVERKDGQSNPDYRRWGHGYWTQNTRLMYWPMLAAGDFDMMQAGMRLHLDQVPIAKERNRIFFNRPDSLFNCETAYFWGLPMMGEYGGFDWDKPGEAVFMSCLYINRHWNGGLEMANMMLDYCAYREDRTFLKESVVPYADAVVRFYELISPQRDENGKMLITEATALETWWKSVNPMPDVAGLWCVTDRLLALPEDCTTPEQRTYWKELQKILPEFPIGDVTSRDRVKRRMLLPAMQYSDKHNMEVPELYALFPFQIFGIERGELEAARHAFEQRRDKHYRGWGQDEIFAAHLGLADDAATGLANRFDTWAEGFRFPAMWGPNFDWIPDQDHGGAGMIALQAMLLQSVGDKILLFPAWRKDWDVEFKLHAPHRTVVEAKYVGGKLVELSVEPPERRKDIVISGGD